MTVDVVCAFCDNKSTLLCDGILASLKDEAFDRPIHDRSGEAFTCDLPICRKCAKCAGITHYNMKPKHEFDTKDFCPLCVKEGRDQHRVEFLLVARHDGEAMQRRRNLSLAVRPLKNPIKEILV